MAASIWAYPRPPAAPYYRDYTVNVALDAVNGVAAVTVATVVQDENTAVKIVVPTANVTVSIPQTITGPMGFVANVTVAGYGATAGFVPLRANVTVTAPPYMLVPHAPVQVANVTVGAPKPIVSGQAPTRAYPRQYQAVTPPLLWVYAIYGQPDCPNVTATGLQTAAFVVHVTNVGLANVTGATYQVASVVKATAGRSNVTVAGVNAIATPGPGGPSWVTPNVNVIGQSAMAVNNQPMDLPNAAVTAYLPGNTNVVFAGLANVTVTSNSPASENVAVIGVPVVNVQATGYNVGGFLVNPQLQQPANVTVTAYLPGDTVAFTAQAATPVQVQAYQPTITTSAFVHVPTTPNVTVFSGITAVGEASWAFPAAANVSVTGLDQLNTFQSALPVSTNVAVSAYVPGQTHMEQVANVVVSAPDGGQLAWTLTSSVTNVVVTGLDVTPTNPGLVPVNNVVVAQPTTVSVVGAPVASTNVTVAAYGITATTVSNILAGVAQVGVAAPVFRAKVSSTVGTNVNVAAYGLQFHYTQSAPLVNVNVLAYENVVTSVTPVYPSMALVVVEGYNQGANTMALVVAVDLIDIPVTAYPPQFAGQLVFVGEDSMRLVVEPALYSDTISPEPEDVMAYE